MAARRLSRYLKDLRFLQSHPSPATNLSSGSAYRNVGDLKILNPHFPAVVREIHGLTHPVSSKNVANCKLPFAMGITRRLFSADISSLPSITDPDIKAILKDLMAASWDELPHAVVVEAGIVLSKSTEDRAGQEALANVLRAAEAVEHFAGVLVSLRMELDDSIGINGEKVGRMAEYLQDALDAAYKRYVAYLDAFGPDEVYLRKKVENELGTKMIQIKLRCGGLGSEWGKVTVLGTSGLAGSYVEHRAP